MEPVTLAAGTIAQLAFNEFIKSSAGEVAKKLTGEALAKANDLRKAILIEANLLIFTLSAIDSWLSFG